MSDGRLAAGPTKRPLVTIAVPTFNRPAMLEPCLIRLLDRVGGDVDIYVSDDASGEETAKVLAKFDDARLRKSRNATNLGLFENFNHCLANAVGEFIIFLSDDDLIDDDLIPLCLALLDGISGTSAADDIVCLIAANRYLTINRAGRRTMSEVRSRIPTGFYDGDVILEQLWLGRISFQLCGMLFRTEALRAIGGFTTGHKYAGDVRTFATLFFGRRVAFEASPRCTYVVHSRSESAALGPGYRLNNILDVFREILQLSRSQLNTERCHKIEASARRYVTTEYTRIVVDFRSAGGSRRACVAAVLPGLRWMVGPGARTALAFWKLSKAVLRPLRLRASA